MEQFGDSAVCVCHQLDSQSWLFILPPYMNCKLRLTALRFDEVYNIRISFKGKICVFFCVVVFRDQKVCQVVG